MTYIMNRNERETRGKSENFDKKSFSFSDIPVWFHFVVIGIILAVIAFSVFKLVKWNQGTAELDQTETGSMEIEVLDQIFLLPEANREGHEYDDEETILFLGNDAITHMQGDDGVCNKVAQKLGATVINCGFPSSCVANKNANFYDGDAIDAFSFINVANSIASGDYSLMEQNAGKFDNGTYQASINNLKSLDFNKVDTIVIYYNAQDYLNGRIGMDPNNDVNPITYRGALNAGIKALQEKYPFIRIVCMSFTMCYGYDSTGMVSGDRVDLGNGKLTTYLQFMIDISGERGVSFVDNYYGTIDEDNADQMLTDIIHVNEACNEHIAQHFVEAIYPGDN